MIRRLSAILLAGMILVAGLAWADDDAPDKKAVPEGKTRLKRKKRADSPPAKAPGKSDKDKAPGTKEKPPGNDKDKAKDAEDQGIVPEDGPDGEPEEDDREILERLSNSMRAVEEKLGNRELGEPTSQQQRDVLKDLDSLIR